VLKVVKLQGAMFYNGEFSSPWSLCSPPSHMVAPYVAPAAGHVIIYHLRGDWSTPKTSASAATIGVAPQVIARINRLSWQRKDSRSQGSWQGRSVWTGLRVSELIGLKWALHPCRQHHGRGTILPAEALHGLGPKGKVLLAPCSIRIYTDSTDT
jgi:hypothetical protein